MSFSEKRSGNQTTPVSSKVRLRDAGDQTTKQRPPKGAAGAERASAARLDTALQTEHATASESVVFVITRRDSEFIEAPIFHAGDDGSEEAVAVFTVKQAAQTYVEQADWISTSEVVALSSRDLYGWLRDAYQQGVSYAAVNPSRRSHLTGDPQPVLTLDGLNNDTDESLLRLLKTFAHERATT